MKQIYQSLIMEITDTNLHDNLYSFFLIFGSLSGILLIEIIWNHIETFNPLK